MPAAAPASAPGTINEVIGIVKAYTTRVGHGPFPSELFDAIGDRIQERGAEFGATTGRRRRCGWLDTVILKNAVRLNGLTGLAITKLDVLDGLESLNICTGYDYRGEILTEFPASLKVLEECKPVYETLPGWSENIGGIASWRICRPMPKAIWIALRNSPKRRSTSYPWGRTGIRPLF